MIWHGLPFWLAPGLETAGAGEITEAPTLRVQSVGWWDRIGRVSLLPEAPRTSDALVITVSGRKSAENIGIEKKAVRIDGRRIVLDVYWSNEPPLVSLPADGLWDSLQAQTDYCYSHTLGGCEAGPHTVVVKHWRNGHLCASGYALFAVSDDDRAARAC